MPDREKEAREIEKRKQHAEAVGWISLLLSLVVSLWVPYDGDSGFLQFVFSAAPWVMMGIGIICIFYSHEKMR